MGRLTEDMTNLRGEIDALHNGRVEFIAGLKQNVFELKAGFNSNHAEMAAKLRDDLDEFVSELKNDVVELKAGFNSNHAEMAGELRDGLETFVSDLKGSVADLRQEAADDIAGAHKAWFGPSPAEPKVIVETRARAVDKEEPRAAEEPQRQEDEDEAEEEAESLEAEEAGTAEEVIPDDLTVITGIGLTRKGQLNEAGYYTFAQLAQSTPQKLREILGESARSANLENWIEQAKDLAE